jgi:hypothetical protein
MLHRPAIKGQYTSHIGAVKFKETLEEHSWSWLILNQLQYVTECIADIETLKEQQLPQGNSVDPNVVNILKPCFISRLGILLGVLLSYIDHLDVSCKLELNQILGIDFQIVRALKRMNHFHLAVDRFDTPLSLRAEAENVDSHLVDCHKVHVLEEVEALDLGLPELEALMGVQQPGGF